MNRQHSFAGLCRLFLVVLCAGVFSACTTVSPSQEAIQASKVEPATSASTDPLIRQLPSLPSQREIAPLAMVLSIQTLDHTTLSPPTIFPVVPVRLQPDYLSVGCLAGAIYHEARGEPVRGMLAVGYVVLNRTEDARFPSTVCGVVKQRTQNSCQFSYYCQKAPLRVKDKDAYERAVILATSVLLREVENPVGKSLYFHHINVKSPKSVKVSSRMRIGSHYFYA